MLNTIEQIKAVHRVTGGYFFSAGAMRFFRSRVSGKVHVNQYGAYFVTSERYDEQSPRLYTVRYCGNDGHIETVNDFQGFRTLKGAHRTAERYRDPLVKRPKRF